MSTNDFEKKVRQKMDELNFVPSGTVWKEIEVKIRKRKERRRLLIWLPLLGLLLGSGFWAYTHYASPDKDLAVQQHTIPSTVSASEKTDNNNELKKENTEKNIHATTKIPVTTPGNTASQRAKETTASNPSKSVKAVVAAPPVAANNKPATLPVVKDNDRPNTRAQKSNTQPAPPVYQPKQQHRNKNISANNDVVSVDAGNKKIDAPVSNNRPKVKTGKADQVVVNNDVSQIKTDDATEKTLAEKIATTKSIAQKPIDDDKKEVDITANNKSVTDSVEKAATAETLKADSNATAQAKKPVVKKKKKIEWGFSGGIGLSGVSNTLFTQEKALYSSSPSPSNSFTSAPGNAGVPVFNGPSAVNSGTSFSLGVQARKSIGGTFSVLAGIQYSYYSTRIEVGSKVDRQAFVAQNTTFDRNVNTYYTSVATATQPYVNSYHFIEVPVTVEKQLGIKSRFAINAGASLGFFAGSNALHYDQQRTIYYKDNTLFNKTQVNLLAGMSWRMLQRKKYSVAIAPGFRYGATNFFRKEKYGSKHLFSAGLGIQVFFGKK
jgi:hypothetical protein